MESWVMMHQYNKSPADLGLSWDEVDPWWHDGIQRVAAGYSRAMKDDTG